MLTTATDIRPAVQSRLAWLDALRGLGAAAVVAEHLFTWAMPWLRPVWFNIGMYGVLVFFLVSGYIIPHSLERRGDVRAFWIGRLFRLYPLYLAVIALALAVSWWIPIRAEVPRDPSAIASHATMLLDVVGAGGVVNTMWTLSYEMIFYLLVSALFAAGLHRGRSWIALALGVTALVSGLFVAGPLLSGGWLAWTSMVLVVLGLAAMISGRLRGPAAIVLGVMALLLLLLSSRVPWFGVAVVAVMFAGTGIQRWERGDGSLWPVLLTGALVAATPIWALNAGWWWVQPDVWISTIVLAGVTFAAVMALRGRPMPRALTWLGLVSYSLYLLHLPILTMMIAAVGEMRWAPTHLQLAIGAAFLLVLVPATWLSHRVIEQPMQRLGRTLSGGA
ncbi:acyltransferase family protein [Nonomuraea soli]|uniref:Peptidoglycan/LPS O-acetylase OafA/YrhL n=1 Tax=Nonomuraea soli TaxID=1032476 RepID=A0A7W0HPA6_9ACTN|nr:acyltransferase [Nonomuraea soli]MBA2890381.1 peptidoglycan/LPS O-acetylase OafA/YrhL [Nonomuraea soli]